MNMHKIMQLLVKTMRIVKFKGTVVSQVLQALHIVSKVKDTVSSCSHFFLGSIPMTQELHLPTCIPHKTDCEYMTAPDQFHFQILVLIPLILMSLLYHFYPREIAALIF